MITPAGNNARRVRDAILGTALGVGANLARNALVGAVQGAGRRVRNGARNFVAGGPNGDVSQPSTARTVQQVTVVRPARARRGLGQGPTQVESGTVKITDVAAVAASVPTGCALLSVPLTPTVLGGRLFALSTIYSRWKILNARLRFVPCVSSATDGGLVIYYTQEPDDTYSVGEIVGASNAASAQDNVELSVREKAAIVLHPPSQELYTTPNAGSTDSWHCAGVVNVISGGSLTAGKTYGALYLDYTVAFKQPTAPYDVFAPAYVLAGKNMAGSGAAGPGASGGALWDWSYDLSDFDLSSGRGFFMDPATKQFDTFGRIHVPPFTSVHILLEMTDTAGVAANIADVRSGGIVYCASSVGAARSSDNTFKSYDATYTNPSANDANFKLVAGGPGYVNTSYRCVLTKVAYVPA